ncbi:hypothetical protein ACTHGU_13995 [Chitinophagaceae bacterium MMS25-I14]
MEQQFWLPIHYRGQDVELPMRLSISGYIYRFIISLPDAELTVERDEEGNLRLLADQAAATTVDKALTEAIINSLKQLL